MTQPDARPETAAGDLPVGAIAVPWNVVIPEVDVHVIGYGMRLPNDLTLEALAVLRRCKRVFGAPPIEAPDFGVPPMENVAGLHAGDEAAIAAAVLDAAGADPPVGFATCGSPVVGTGVAHRIIELADERGLSVHVTNAVSSFDGLYADLNIEPFLGVEIWAASTFVRLAIEPRCDAHLVLPGLALVSGELAKLRDHLLRVYPPDLDVHVATTSAHAGPHLLGGGIETIALKDLVTHGARSGGTLVVPRPRRRKFDFGRPPTSREARKGATAARTDSTRNAGRPLVVPWRLVVPDVDLHVVGFGNRLPNDFTLEMLAVLQRCRRIFAYPPLHAPQYAIPPMESLMHLFGKDKPRAQTCAEWVEIVLDAAATEPPVAFATTGSGMVGTWTAHRLLELANEHGLTAHVTNATSSLEGIWADLSIDPWHGLVIWEASFFVGRKIVPDTRANLLLPQAPVVNVRTGIDLGTMMMEPSSTVPELRDHLLRFYPPEHEVCFVTTDHGPGAVVAPYVERVTLRDLDGPGRRQLATLLVPRLGAPELDVAGAARASASHTSTT